MLSRLLSKVPSKSFVIRNTPCSHIHGEGVMMRLRLAWLSGTLLVGLTAASPAGAQTSGAATTTGFAIDRYDPAEAGSNWFALESVDWEGQLRPSVGLVLDFANHPLVLYNSDGSQRTVVVGNQFFTHVNASLAYLDWIRFGVSVPVALAQSGDLGTL